MDFIKGVEVVMRVKYIYSRGYVFFFLKDVYLKKKKNEESESIV